MNWEQESGGTRFPGCEHARQGDQLPDSLPWRGKRGDGGSGVLWGLDFPSCHCFPFISVRHTHTLHSHAHPMRTSAGHRTVSELGVDGQGGRLPLLPLGPEGRGGAVFGDSVSRGRWRLRRWPSCHRRRGCPLSDPAGCRARRPRSPVRSQQAGPGAGRWKSRAPAEGVAVGARPRPRSAG